jgi:hypothetical protein
LVAGARYQRIRTPASKLAQGIEGGFRDMTVQTERPRWAIAAAILVDSFGALSLRSGGEVLFIDGAGREAAESYLPYVVWFNFLAGFAYIGGAVGLVQWRSWITPLAFSIATLTIIVFIAFGIHILIGGAYEFRTVGAMSLRSLVWLGIAISIRERI